MCVTTYSGFSARLYYYSQPRRTSPPTTTTPPTPPRGALCASLLACYYSPHAWSHAVLCSAAAASATETYFLPASLPPPLQAPTPTTVALAIQVFMGVHALRRAIVDGLLSCFLQQHHPPLTMPASAAASASSASSASAAAVRPVQAARRGESDLVDSAPRLGARDAARSGARQARRVRVAL